MVLVDNGANVVLVFFAQRRLVSNAHVLPAGAILATENVAGPVRRI